MNAEFVNNLGDRCVFCDDGVRYYSNKRNLFYPYGCIEGFSTQLGCLTLKSNNEGFTFPFHRKYKSQIKDAIEFAKSKMKTAPPAKIETIEIEKPKPVEYRMRCNVCGKVFCYTTNDLINNLKNAQNAQSSAKTGVVNAIFGTQLGMYANINSAEKYLSQIKDYSKCPNCNSNDISLIEEGENIVTSTASSTPTSAADEIKKFKELLDTGIITQEEFDAKKKQLLGL